MTENKRFTLTKGFDEHERQIRDNGKIIMGCFHEVQAKPIVVLLNELNDENTQLKFQLKECREHKLFSRRQIEQENKELKHYNEAYADEIVHIKHTIKTMMKNERTEIGKNTLKQLWEAIQ